MNREAAPARISLKGVSKRYEAGDGPIRALSNIDLTIPDGAFYSVVGPSGSGKTTLLRLIAGLDHPTSGQVRIGDTPVEDAGPDRGLVFQDVTLFPWRTVAENVRFGLEVDGTSPAAADRRVEDLLSMVGLAKRRDSYPDELSGGMTKRVGIARALAPDPEILLLDEPFSDLDVATRESLKRDLLDLWKRLEKTVLLVTHTVGEAVRLSDSVVLVQGQPGRVDTVVDVDIDRPRDPETDSFRPYVNAIRDSIWSSHTDRIVFDPKQT